MAQGGTLQVEGYRQLMIAFAHADRDTKRGMREAFRRVGDSVLADATRLFAPTDARSAAGYKTRVRQRGVIVEQSLRKTTGKHPEYGALQMRRALVPALTSNEDETERAMEQAMEDMCDHFNRGAP